MFTLVSIPSIELLSPLTSPIMIGIIGATVVLMIGNTIAKGLLKKDLVRIPLNRKVRRKKKRNKQSFHDIIFQLISKLEIEITMQSIISIIILTASLYVILSKQYNDGSQKWAIAAIASIIGFWLKRN